MNNRYAAQSQAGFAKAALYDQHRPSYPAEAVESLLSGLQISRATGSPSSNTTIVDLAAGTGKLTELLVKRPEQYNVVAVEPDENMRAELVRKELGNVSVVDGVADRIPLEDQSVDAVVAAQAFHWFPHQETLAEVNRILRPRAYFGMIWNVEDYNAPLHFQTTTKWEEILRKYMHTFDDRHDRFRHYKWPAVFEQQKQRYFTTPLRDDVVEWTVWLPREKLFDRWMTLSQLAVLEGEERKVAENVFKEAMASDDLETNDKGEIAFHGVTYTTWTQKA